MNVAIVVAAGKGTRIGGNQPKQFLELGGVPIIIHTLRRFEQCDAINEVILVLPADAVAGFVSLAGKFGLSKVSQVVAGGLTRAQSVRCGLRAISHAEIVAVHDGVRPFVTPDEIDRVVEAARESGAAVLVSPITDTIKEITNGSVGRTLPRSDLRRALTPQCFHYDILKRAYKRLDEAEAEGVDITDDSLLVERLGVKVATVEGSASNIKITGPEDIATAEVILKSVVSGQ
jgi:2-C-methyl-D-erythritol 4-phosphate cytidylyltransferase